MTKTKSEGEDFIAAVAGATVFDAGPCEKGGRHLILHKDGKVLRQGTGTPAKMGQPVQPGECLLYTEGGKVTGGYASPGPSTASTPRYRENYERTFGPKSELN